MPEIRFNITWPDGAQENCYSPSLIVQEYFTSGTSLRIASDRVAQKFGFPCSRALGQLAAIEAACARYTHIPGAQVRFGNFDE